MHEVFDAVLHLKALFDKYAGKDGDPTSLSKKELSDMLKLEAGDPSASHKDEMDQFFSMLDTDKDGVVNFTEFTALVVSLCMLCNDS